MRMPHPGGGLHLERGFLALALWASLSRGLAPLKGASWKEWLAYTHRVSSFSGLIISLELPPS